MKINLVDKNGVTLKTAGTYVEEDIQVGLSEADQSALVAENIAKDKTILGVTGTLESGGDTTQEDALLEGKLTTYSNSRIKSVGYRVFYHSTLEEIDLPNVTSIGSEAFMYAGALTSINIPNVTMIDTQTFRYCFALTSINITNVTRIKSGGFNECRLLPKIDLQKITYIDNAAFYNCYSLKKVIIRQSDSVCSLSSTNAFTACYHILGTVNATYNPNGDKDGYICVPYALVEDYKAATNWSTYADQIIPIFSIKCFGGGSINETTNSNNETILSAIGNNFVGWYKGFVIKTQEIISSVAGTYNALEVAYPFELNDSGYYQNTNQKVDGSFSIGRFNFNIENENQFLRIIYLQSSEQNYDYGIIGNVDIALEQNITTTGYKTLKGVTTTTASEIFIYNIGVGEHFIDIKYIKDNGGNSGTDTLQVKVEVVTTEIKEVLDGELYSNDVEINIGVVDEQTMEPLNLVAVFEEE